MEMTQEMLLTLQKRIQESLFRKTNYHYIVGIIKRDKKIFCIVSSLGDVRKAAFFSDNLEKFKHIIETATELNWKLERDIFILESGYVVFYDFDYETFKDRDLLLQEFWYIEDAELDFRGFYVDGKLSDEEPPEFSVDCFEFSRDLPDQKTLEQKFDDKIESEESNG